MSSLNRDALEHITSLLDPKTRLTLQRTNKSIAAFGKLTMKDLEPIAKDAARYFETSDVFKDGIKYGINLDVKVKGTRIAFRTIEVTPTFVDISDTLNYDDFHPDTHEILGKRIEVTRTENKSYQDLFLHAAACYYMEANMINIQKKSDENASNLDKFPKPNEWPKYAKDSLTRLLDRINANIPVTDYIKIRRTPVSITGGKASSSKKK